MASGKISDSSSQTPIDDHRRQHEVAAGRGLCARPDLVVLDVMMPGLDGFDVLRRLRDDGTRTPVLFLTARDATEDKVVGLTLGADDYVTKPFSLEELIARIRALLRRAGNVTTPARLAFADIELDDDSHEVRKAGKPCCATSCSNRTAC
jgi:two-component system OmpR family response regulator